MPNIKTPRDTAIGGSVICATLGSLAKSFSRLAEGLCIGVSITKWNADDQTSKLDRAHAATETAFSGVTVQQLLETSDPIIPLREVQIPIVDCLVAGEPFREGVPSSLPPVDRILQTYRRSAFLNVKIDTD